MIHLHKCEQCDDARFHGKEFCERHTPKTLGKELRAARKKKGLTVMQVADAFGVHAVFITDIEDGKQEPSLLVELQLRKLYQRNDGKTPTPGTTQEPAPLLPEDSATTATERPLTIEEELREMGVEPMRYLSEEERAQDLIEVRRRIEEHRTNKGRDELI